MLTEVFIVPGNRYRQLACPLGLWKCLNNKEWVWWLDPTSGDIFEQHPDLAWWKWRALSTHHQQCRFSLDGPTLDSPPLSSVRVSVRVTGRTLRLLTEGPVAPQVERPPLPRCMKPLSPSLARVTGWCSMQRLQMRAGQLLQQSVLVQLWR